MPKGVHERTEEIRRKMSEAAKKMWKDPEYREKISKVFNRPEVKAKLRKPRSEKAKTNMKGHSGVYKRTDEMRRNISEGHKGKKHSKEHRIKNRDAQIKRYQNPQEREKTIKALNRPETKARMIKARKKWWTKMTKEERLKYLKLWLEAGQKTPRTLETRLRISRRRKKWFAKMTKEEKSQFLKPFYQAGHKATQRQWKRMNKEDRLKRMLPAIMSAPHANPSSIEKMIWKALNEFSINYKTHVSFNNGKFVIDIYVPAQRLIIECNGDYWHNLPEIKERDKKLKEYARSNNYELVELWEADIRKSPKQALQDGLNPEKREWLEKKLEVK